MQRAWNCGSHPVKNVFDVFPEYVTERNRDEDARIDVSGAVDVIV
jgi:hypothetical protein